MLVHPMHVVTVQPGMLTRPVFGVKTETWSSGLYSCFADMGTCCFGCWCPCCLACNISSDFGECLCLPLVDILGVGIVPAATLAVRSSMRERYSIQGSVCDDCLVVTCCPACALCQMARELKHHKRQLLLARDPAAAVVEVSPINPPPQAPNYSAQPLYPAGLYPPVP